MNQSREGYIRFLEGLIAYADKVDREHWERIEYYGRTGSIDGPKKSPQWANFLTSTVGKIIGIAFHGAEPEWVNFQAPPFGEAPPADLSESQISVYEGAVERRKIQDQISARVRGALNRLIERLREDDGALVPFGQSLQSLLESRARKDMQLLHELLQANGVDPDYTMEEINKYQMHLRLKLKKRVKNLLKEASGM